MAAGGSEAVVLFDTATNKESRWLPIPHASENLVFDATGWYLLTANGNGTIYVFRLADAVK